MTEHSKGFSLTLLGVLILCPDTLLVRLVQADTWVLMVWRNGLMGLGMLVLAFFMSAYCSRRAEPPRSTPWTLGWALLAVMLLFGMNNATFVLALAHTSVANTLFILAGIPLFSALFSRFFLNEKTALRTWVAMLAVGLGFGIIFRGSSESGGLLGDLFALTAAIGIAASFTVIRAHRSVDFLPAIAIGSLLAAAFGLAVGQSVTIAQGDLTWLFIMGFLIAPISFALITLGPRYLPASEVGLLMLLEAAIGPLLVWAVLGEEVPMETVIGGTIVILSLALHSIVGLRQEVARSRMAKTDLGKA